MADVEFEDQLETIGNNASDGCSSLEHLKLPSIVTIGISSFHYCNRLIDIELSERLETIDTAAFCGCERLRRIAIPMKRDLFAFHYIYNRYTQFDYCEQLTTIDLVGRIHKTVDSLHMESWRVEMHGEINRINHVLPNTTIHRKTTAIRQWIGSTMKKWIITKLSTADISRRE